ncbi:unnamed protein product [Brugia timori]|uniref:50S ribosomal protein L33 n=1 Tax=Brugia timori TaxID=42155 RepID=A0A0R3R979_9BILA|nr:unnamed protein product [Brugia timori]
MKSFTFEKSHREYLTISGSDMRNQKGKSKVFRKKKTAYNNQ